MEYKIPGVSTLLRIRSLSEINSTQLIALANQLQEFTATKGELILARGSLEESSLYVLGGSISLTAADGQVKLLTIDENEALNPIAKLRPCIYDIHARETIEYLKINKQALVEFTQLTESTSEDFSVVSLYSDQSNYTKSLICDLYQNISSNEVQMPSLPRAAIDISRLYRHDISDTGLLAKVLTSYPEISRKLIKKVVKDKHQDEQELSKVMHEIAGRLGTKRAYYMIMTHVVNKLFFPQPKELMEALKSHREHSLEVAATCRVLAKANPQINHDRAMLAGMSHGIGSVVIVGFLLNSDSFALDPDETAEAVNTLGAEFTSLLLKRWKFSDEIIQATENCEDWFRNQGDATDLCDLVLVANYHALVKTDRATSLPPISSIPAMKKLNITNHASATLIEKARAEKEKIEKMLRF